MRKALNENPVVQVVLIGVLGVAAALLFFMNMGGSGSEEAAPATAPADSSATAPDAAATDASATAPEAAAAGAGAAPAVPGAVEATPAAGGGEGFVAGPGLPKPVVRAYDDGATVVVLITRKAGVDDRALRREVKALDGRPEVAAFTAAAKHVARYSRITEGVDIDRVPALIALSPKQVSGAMPKATVAYGYRDIESVAQAVANARYKGPELPYHPK
jgi:hypothetical protein